MKSAVEEATRKTTAIRIVARYTFFSGLAITILGTAWGGLLHSIFGVSVGSFGLIIWSIGTLLYAVRSITDPESDVFKVVLQIAVAVALAFVGWGASNNSIRDLMEGPITSEGTIASIEYHDSDDSIPSYKLCITLTGTNGDIGSLGSHADLANKPQCFDYLISIHDMSMEYPKGTEVRVKFYLHTTTLEDIQRIG